METKSEVILLAKNVDAVYDREDGTHYIEILKKININLQIYYKNTTFNVN